MKQQAPKTLPQKAETIENTRKTADILIGAACQKEMPSKWMAFLFGIWAPQRTRGSIASILPSTDGRDATQLLAQPKENAQGHGGGPAAGVLPYARFIC